MNLLAQIFGSLKSIRIAFDSSHFSGALFLVATTFTGAISILTMILHQAIIFGIRNESEEIQNVYDTTSNFDSVSDGTLAALNQISNSNLEILETSLELLNLTRFYGAICVIAVIVALTSLFQKRKIYSIMCMVVSLATTFIVMGLV